MCLRRAMLSEGVYLLINLTFSDDQRSSCLLKLSELRINFTIFYVIILGFEHPRRHHASRIITIITTHGRKPRLWVTLVWISMLDTGKGVKIIMLQCFEVFLD